MKHRNFQHDGRAPTDEPRALPSSHADRPSENAARAELSGLATAGSPPPPRQGPRPNPWPLGGSQFSPIKETSHPSQDPHKGKSVMPKQAAFEKQNAWIHQKINRQRRDTQLQSSSRRRLLIPDPPKYGRGKARAGGRVGNGSDGLSPHSGSCPPGSSPDFPLRWTTLIINPSALFNACASVTEKTARDVGCRLPPSA